MNILNRLALELKNPDPEKSIVYARQAAELSEKINYLKGLGISNVNIGAANLQVGKYTEALQCLMKALEICAKTGDKLCKARALNSMGSVYKNQFNYYAAIKKHSEALSLFKELGDQMGMAAVYFELGKLYNYIGNYPESLKQYYAVLKLYEEKKFTEGIMATYVNISENYNEQGNMKEALKLNFLALDIAKKINNKEGLAICYNNIGDAYYKNGNYAGALYYNKASIELCRETNDIEGEGVSYGNIGEIYEKQGHYSASLTMYERALKIAGETGDEEGVTIANIHIGRIYTKQKKYNGAEVYLKNALSNATKKGALGLTRDCYEGLTELYKLQKDYRKTFECYTTYISYRDSLFNEENTKKTVRAKMQYEFDKKASADSIKNQQEQKVKNAEIAAQNAVIEKGKAQFWFVVSGLFIVGIALVIVINRFRLTNKQKKIIEKQNFQIVESINYSRKIQDSLLPDKKEMQQAINSLFIFYHPKDIVSGDFYWYKQVNNFTLVACVDCTGHGVPGAFMSTLGSLLLDKLVNDNLVMPSEILNRLNDEIIRTLHQQSGGSLQDGMDISLCLMDKVNKTILFSGARNGLIVVKDKTAQRYKADVLPVGGNYMKNGKALERNFKTQEITLSPNDWVYMYTDGFMEQIGGKEGLPMTYHQFEELLVQVSSLENTEEKNKLLQLKLDQWRGPRQRTDDVLVMGFKVD